jgi:hypothetical protein
MFGGLGSMFSHQQHGCCCQCHSQHTALQSAAQLSANQVWERGPQSAINFLLNPYAVKWREEYDPNLTPEQRETYQRNDWEKGYKP